LKGIEIRNGCLYYYSNPAGYIDKDIVVMDNLFRSRELECWVSKRGFSPQWIDGVYDRLSSGTYDQSGEPPIPLKSCRIWQLKPDVDVMMKFIGYDEMTRRFGEPSPENYTPAYDGQIETNDLESIWTKFNTRHTPGYTGHSLSMSDVIELYDHTGSEFHYVDRFGFKQISFGNLEPGEFGQAQRMAINM